MVRLNRLPVFSMVSEIDIMDHVRSFACNTLLQVGLNNNFVILKKRKEMTTSTDNESPVTRYASGSSHYDTETVLIRCQ